ncbi:MAG: TadE/TadG family type IV pilus assembly protein [Bacteroides sp.]
MDNKKLSGQLHTVRKSESGMMVVEAVISFTVFIMVTLSIVYLTNIFTIHNRIQFAINSAAHQIAGYTYIYQGIGLRDGEKVLQGDIKTYVTPIDDTATTILGAYNDIQKTINDIKGAGDSMKEISPESVQNVMTQIDTIAKDVDKSATSIEASSQKLSDLFSDPDALMAGVIYAGASFGMKEIKGAIAAGLSKALTKGYLNTNGYSDVDDYLKAYGIKDGYSGLDFKGSTMMCDGDQRMIDIVVQYDIDMSFLSFVIPDAKIHMVQRVSVPAWVNGDSAKLPEKK